MGVPLTELLEKLKIKRVKYKKLTLVKRSAAVTVQVAIKLTKFVN